MSLLNAHLGPKAQDYEKSGSRAERMKTITRVVFLLFLVSCGGGDPSGGDAAAGNAVPFDQVASVFRKAVCDKIFQCCSRAELVANPDLGNDSTSCQGALDGEASIFLNDIQASVTAGRVVYHGDRMATCLWQIQSRSCDELKMPLGDRDINDLCGDVFESKVPIGGKCSGYWDCIGGWCEGDEGNAMDMCSPKKPLGGDCDEGPECQSGDCDAIDRVCVNPEEGSGNLCRFGTESVGQHGVIPPGTGPDAAVNQSADAGAD
jgi:hypothetical protein